MSAGLRQSLDDQPRIRLAALPTPLEAGPVLPGGARLWLKRDDLTGLGLGGNKVRKLEFLCAAARQEGADLLVTVGAAQSNHCRLTAAAAAVLGIECHLFVGGPPAREMAGNQLLSALFGAHMHFPGTDDWDELEGAMARRVASWRAEGRKPFAIPIGGSTAVGARGYVAAWMEMAEQCRERGIEPVAIVHASSSGGTHAGLIAGRRGNGGGPRIIAAGVAKTSGDLRSETAAIAAACLQGLGQPSIIPADEIEVDSSQQGAAYAVPTRAADEAIRWAARHAAIALDRVYTGKAFALLLALTRQGRFGAGDDVVFLHTGGFPALFAPGGAPDLSGEAKS
ncbi:MAG: D-cysteine desulfhydrase family protein [Chloroflexota bacterium]